jgi:hypothetical protein
MTATGLGRAGVGLALLLSLSIVTAVLVFAGAPASGLSGPTPDIARFQFELQAQSHCPGEAIVWIEARSRTYDISTDRFYGRTTTGAFACVRDAENAGYHAKRGL